MISQNIVFRILFAFKEGYEWFTDNTSGINRYLFTSMAFICDHSNGSRIFGNYILVIGKKN